MYVEMSGTKIGEKVVKLKFILKLVYTCYVWTTVIFIRSMNLNRKFETSQPLM